MCSETNEKVAAGRTVSVLIRSAKGLRNADKTADGIKAMLRMKAEADLSDPFCVCRLLDPEGKMKDHFNTDTVENSLEPEWKKEEQQFSGVQEGDTIEFKVWDKDYLPGMGDDFLGKVTVKAEDFLTHGLDNPKLKLEDSEKAGEGKDASISVKIAAVSAPTGPPPGEPAKAAPTPGPSPRPAPPKAAEPLADPGSI